MRRLSKRRCRRLSLNTRIVTRLPGGQHGNDELCVRKAARRRAERERVQHLGADVLRAREDLILQRGQGLQCEHQGDDEHWDGDLEQQRQRRAALQLRVLERERHHVCAEAAAAAARGGRHAGETSRRRPRAVIS